MQLQQKPKSIYMYVQICIPHTVHVSVVAVSPWHTPSAYQSPLPLAVAVVACPGYPAVFGNLHFPQSPASRSRTLFSIFASPLPAHQACHPHWFSTLAWCLFRDLWLRSRNTSKCGSFISVVILCVCLPQIYHTREGCVGRMAWSTWVTKSACVQPTLSSKCSFAITPRYERTANNGGCNSVTDGLRAFSLYSPDKHKYPLLAWHHVCIILTFFQSQHTILKVTCLIHRQFFWWKILQFCLWAKFISMCMMATHACEDSRFQPEWGVHLDLSHTNLAKEVTGLTRSPSSQEIPQRCYGGARLTHPKWWIEAPGQPRDGEQDCWWDVWTTTRD